MTHNVLSTLGTIYVLRKKNEIGDMTIKIGSTTLTLEKRILQYRTSEKDFNNDTHELWKFKISKSVYNCYQIDDLIQKFSIERNIPYKKYVGKGGGIGHYYFDNDIEKLTKFFEDIDTETIFEKVNIDELEIQMQKLNEKDVKKECNCEDDKIVKSVDIQKILELYDIKKSFKPREDQETIINETYDHFKNHDKGILILMCGTGKTLISLWICQRMNMEKICIGVPNTLLLEQWEREIQKIYPKIKILKVHRRVTKDDIISFLEENDQIAVITTYSSCHKVYEATKKINFKFDMKINDECHHLTTKSMQDEGTTKTFIEMVHIPSIKQLSLTATIKYLKDKNSKLRIVSNSNVEIFGDVIVKGTLLQAIDRKILCDYQVQTIITDYNELEIVANKMNISEENDKQLFFSAYTALKSISDKNSHHLLIYSNNVNNSKKINDFINLLKEKYFEIDELYTSVYNGEMKSKVQQEIIKNFEEKKHGIICCVYCLGEGWDFPKLDGVVISENMTGNIRIIQSVLRSCRKNKDEPNKIAKIILPILNINCLDDTENNNFRKVKEIICQLGLKDEAVLTKVKVYNINVKDDYSTDFGEYNEEITKQVRTISRYALDTIYEKEKEKNKKDIEIKNDYLNISTFTQLSIKFIQEYLQKLF
jgi:predicted helicase